MMTIKQAVGVVLGLAACFAGAAHGQAAERYPNKPLRLVVPFPPGGGTDILARLVGSRLSERLGSQVVVDNRPGAGTNIGMEIVARAVPDGHTLVMAGVPLATNSSLYRNLTFDPVRELAPISLVASAPTILVSHPSVPARTPQELIILLKSRPGRFNYGSFGNGSGAHLAAVLFKAVTGTDITHVPYKGGAPAITALLGGEVQLVFSSLLPTLPHIKAARIVPVGLAASKRFASLPNVMTFNEAGIAYETGPWFGVLVPARTSPAIVRRLHEEIAAIVWLLEISARIAADGADPVGNSPAEFASFIAAEATRWAQVLQKAEVRVE